MINTREDLAKYFHQLGFKIGAEIGVLEGLYSEILCKANPGLILYCIDSWGTGENKRREYHLQAYEKAKIRLAPYNTAIIYKLSMDAVEDFEDGSLDFVYIDANHRPDFITDDVREWTKKVRKGGIVSGHDYRPGMAKEVVDEFTRMHGFKLEVTPKISDKALSWWFVR
ncbi:MAG: class I SAM-dependent methyltransferase [Candidatus Paceibacterota bacterium]|jgi:predicted O-methyltransferase YrrM|nr:class I SAM-dependent methyltransferase [Candidatus Paceibacterota bacterium]